MRRLVAFLLAALLAMAVSAKEAVPVAADPEAEARATRLAALLRCLVCQNQSLAESNAPLAEDLKRQIREQLQAGRSDEQIVGYMVERYGDFVLYKPPLKLTTVLLWVGPFAILVLAVGGLVLQLRRRRAAPVEGELSEEERARVAALLDAAGGEKR